MTKRRKSKRFLLFIYLSQALYVHVIPHHDVLACYGHMPKRLHDCISLMFHLLMDECLAMKSDPSALICNARITRIRIAFWTVTRPTNHWGRVTPLFLSSPTMSDMDILSAQHPPARKHHDSA